MGGGLTGTTAFCQNLGMPERPKETYPKAQMARITPQLQAEIQQLFPSLVAWAERMESEALSKGIPLNDILKNTAQVLGVKSPDAVRIYLVQSIHQNTSPNDLRDDSALDQNRWPALRGLVVGRELVS
jgi:hypothetical protein